MKKLLLGLLMAAALMPTAASAYTIQILSWTDRTNPFVDVPGQTLATFNSGPGANQWLANNGSGLNAPNVTFTSQDGSSAQSGLFAGNLLNPALEASPYGNANSDRLYLAAGGGGGYVDMHYNGGLINTLGVLWGTVDFLDPARNIIRTENGEVITGANVYAQCQLTAGCSMTDGQTNVLLVISGLTGFDDAKFSDLGANSFEYNVRAIEGVPEPSTWAMMGLGFLGLGFLSMRKRRREGRPAIRFV